MNKKSLLLAGVACVLCATNSFAGWSDMMHNTKYYVGADYAFGHYKHGGVLENAKENYNSGTLNIGVRMDKVGLEAFNQMSGKRTKDMDAGRLKTRVNAYGLDMYAYQPLGCEGKYDLLGTIGLANYYYKGKIDGNSESKNRVGYRIGAGMMYNMTDHISARIVGRFAYLGAKSLENAMEATAGIRYNF